MGEEGEEMLAKSVVYWDQMFTETTERLHDNNVHMVKCYLSNVHTGIDVYYVFAPGDYC